VSAFRVQEHIDLSHATRETYALCGNQMLAHGPFYHFAELSTSHDMADTAAKCYFLFTREDPESGSFFY
jgi:hypothetical protein